MTDDTDKKIAAPTAAKPPAKVVDAPADSSKKVETDGSKRRAAELAGHLADHRAVVAKAHADHPTPPIKFGRMSRDERRRHNAKREIIAASNRTYHLAVRATVARHRAEEPQPRLQFRYDPSSRGRAAR